MRKKLCVVSSVMLVASMSLSGCNSSAKKEDSAKAPSDSSISAPGTFPIAKEKINITVMTPAGSDPSNTLETNAFTKELEEKTNIHINWEFVQSNFKEKMNLAFASNELPDIIDTGVGAVNRMDKTTESQLGSQGLIIPIEKIIDSQAVNFKKILKDDPVLEKYMTTPDNHIYTLPMLNDGYHINYPNKMWINTTWLKNLGLEMPKTTDDFKKVLKAFKDNDPNKNGKKDEIALSTVKAGANVSLDGFLMNAFTYSPAGTDRLYVDNGKITLAAVQDGYKQGLIYLNDLYKEGLINPESFTQDQTHQVNSNESGEVSTLGAFPALHIGYGCNLKASNKWHEYNSVPPLKGPNGVQNSSYDEYGKYTTGMIAITKSCKNPEAVIKMIDYLYSTEGTLRSNVGREGVEWSKAATGDKDYNGEQAKYKANSVDTTKPENMNVAWGQSFPFYAPKEYQFSFAAPQNPYAADVDPMVGRMGIFFKATKEHEQYKPKEGTVLPSLYYSQSEVDEIGRMKTTINDYINESFIKFISGASDINKDWDAYKKQLENLGLQKYLGTVQGAYDKQYKK
jgi:putative aldouronate transport system substrate-binding protein